MLKLVNISKKNPAFSLSHISFDVPKGSYFVLLGKSGVGKSMLLEIIAGITSHDTGQLLFNNKDYSKKTTRERNFVLVYQSLALFPHFTVYQNIRFGMKPHKIPRQTHKKTIEDIANFLGITHLLTRYPKRLSGGEAQRVALARALAIKPDILLLDEPLASLDIEMKMSLQKLLKAINNNGQTIIHVTHDFEEAIALSDRVAVIENGRIVQSGETDEVFKNPRSQFTAKLSGVKNFFKAALKSCHEDKALKTATPEDTEIDIKILTDISAQEGFIAFQAKDVLLSPNKIETTAINNFEGIVTDIRKTHLGVDVTVDIGIPVIAAISRYSFNELQIKKNKNMWVSFKASAPFFILKK